MLNDGELIYSEQEALIHGSMDRFMDDNNLLDGTAIQNTWFPQIDAEIFIFHAHVNEKYALQLAGWLKAKFDINCFIDSTVWRYANELLKNIDDEIRGEKKNYDYNVRNRTTAHVHMMLSSAIMMMIDHCECLIFVNTPESIVPAEDFTKTTSPWIYYELGLSRVIQKKVPLRQLTLEERRFSVQNRVQKAATISYTVDLGHLQEIDQDIRKKWLDVKGQGPEKALDKLYELLPAKKYSDILLG